MENIKCKTLFKTYRYGFKTKLKKEKFPKGLNENIIEELSNLKNEPLFLKKFRLNAYKLWRMQFFPTWSQLNIPKIDFNNIKYYSYQQRDKGSKNEEKIFQTFKKLGLDLENKKISSTKIAIDAIFDSESIVTTSKENLLKYGIIFCSISEAAINYPLLLEKFLGKVVTPGDNFFSALNSAIFTDGSFCYIPKNVKCPIELSSYFRINDPKAGQFERTLIITEKNASVKYLEGCTASRHDNAQLHAAVVELIALENSKIEYFTIQNWYTGNNVGKGGIYNFVTKRALCLGKNSHVSWTQIEIGSSITWKYPSCVLVGEKSSGEFYSIALTNNLQQADTGTKMIHLGNQTTSKILSKAISLGISKNFYRGLVKIGSNAKNARNFTQCDSFLIGNKSISATYPYIDIWNTSSIVEHEAKISKLSEDQIFYLLQRGIPYQQALNLVVSGFCNDILAKLPLEFSSEAEKLLSLKLENAIG